MVFVLALLLIIAAFGLGVFVGYNARSEVKLLPSKKVEPPADSIPAEHLSEIAKKLAEEYKQ